MRFVPSFDCKWNVGVALVTGGATLGFAMRDMPEMAAASGLICVINAGALWFEAQRMTTAQNPTQPITSLPDDTYKTRPSLVVDRQGTVRTEPVIDRRDDHQPYASKTGARLDV